MARIDPRRPDLWIAVTCLVTWVLLAPRTFELNPWIYSWDSAAYIETARSILGGRGLQHRVIQDFGPDIWEPLRLWPPGYPVAIAAVARLGASTTLASLLVSGGAAALAAFAIGLVWARFFSWQVALPGAVATIVTPAFMQISTQAMSDAPYYLCVVASMLSLMNAMRGENPSRGWLLFSGLLAGAAWTVRNTGLALLAAGGGSSYFTVSGSAFGRCSRCWCGGLSACRPVRFLW